MAATQDGWGKTFEKECVLVDEMQLKERLEFDQGLKRFVGYISPETLSVNDIPENCNELACHSIVWYQAESRQLPTSSQE
jgi:hypothetical protein